MQFSKDYKKIKGDASFRKFYKNKKTKSILVYAKKEKNKNLLIYDAINKILIKNGVIAPKLLRQNYKKNYIEIEDLGDKTIYQLFSRNKKSTRNNFRLKTRPPMFSVHVARKTAPCARGLRGRQARARGEEAALAVRPHLDLGVATT